MDRVQVVGDLMETHIVRDARKQAVTINFFSREGTSILIAGAANGTSFVWPWSSAWLAYLANILEL